MSSSCFFALTVVLLLWILTCAALVLCWRQCRKAALDTACAPLDLLATLASARNHEANVASRRLHEVADVLRIGFVLLRGDKVVESNQRASELCLDDFGSDEALSAFLATTSADKPCTYYRSDRAIQLRRLPSSGASEVILMEDVTSTLLLAQKLKQSERLALLGQMSAQVAHQIKTPLAVLAGQAQLLARRVMHDESLRAEADGIYQEARVLAQQVNEILRFYKEREPVFQKSSPCDILEEARRRLVPLASVCELRLDCPEGLSLETDPSLLQNLLFLLGQNALAEEAQATCLSILAMLHGEEFCVRVRDNGRGIPESVRERLFEPFVGTREDSLGLGLFLARDLAGRLRGVLQLEETSERGTSFLLRLPTSARSAAPTYQPP